MCVLEIYGRQCGRVWINALLFHAGLIGVVLLLVTVVIEGQVAVAAEAEVAKRIEDRMRWMLAFFLGLGAFAC